MIDFEKPEDKNYMILESLNQMKDGNNYKSIHIVNLEPENKIVLGNGYGADMRINDISVSRLHGTIYLDPISNKILLKGLGSKFGTLVLIKQEFPITKKVSLQIGRSHVECMKEPFSEELREFQNRISVKKENNLFQQLLKGSN